MGLQEGRRANLLPEELSERDKKRLEERHLERRIVLNTAYQKVRMVLLALALLTAADVLILPRAYKLSFPLAAQAAQICMVFGYRGQLVLWFGAALAVAGVYALLWWLSRNHHRWMIVAAMLFLLDMAGSFFMITIMNYEVTLSQQAQSQGLGNLGVGNASDYLTTFMVTIFVHVVASCYFIYGAVKGAQLRRVPEVSIQEQKVEKTVYHEGKDYTEHPEERTEPIRAAEPSAMRLIQTEINGMQVSVERAYAVTALVVDGQVYNDQKGSVEPLYRLRACVNGVHLLAEHVPMDGFTVMTLYADGKEIGSKKRWL